MRCQVKLITSIAGVHIGYLTSTGDFHFLWECLRVVFMIFWGAPNQPGSLYNVREITRRTSVDKGVKNFNIGDEFLLHAFRAHLKAAVASSLTINTNGEVDHQPTERAARAEKSPHYKAQDWSELRTVGPCAQRKVALMPRAIETHCRMIGAKAPRASRDLLSRHWR